MDRGRKGVGSDAFSETFFIKISYMRAFQKSVPSVPIRPRGWERRGRSGGIPSPIRPRPSPTYGSHENIMPKRKNSQPRWRFKIWRGSPHDIGHAWLFPAGNLESPAGPRIGNPPPILPGNSPHLRSRSSFSKGWDLRFSGPKIQPVLVRVSVFFMPRGSSVPATRGDLR